MASPAKLAAIAGFLAGWLLYMAGIYTIRIRRTSGKTEFARADIVESKKVRRQSLWGAALFGVVAVIMLVMWAV